MLSSFDSLEVVIPRGIRNSSDFTSAGDIFAIFFILINLRNIK